MSYFITALHGLNEVIPYFSTALHGLNQVILYFSTALHCLSEVIPCFSVWHPRYPQPNWPTSCKGSENGEIGNLEGNRGKWEKMEENGGKWRRIGGNGGRGDCKKWLNEQNFGTSRTMQHIALRIAAQLTHGAGTVLLKQKDTYQSRQ